MLNRLLPLFLCLLLIVFPAAAQDTHPLLQLLAYVPQDIAATEGVAISYADYAAMLLDRDGAPIVASDADFTSMSESVRKLWFSNMLRLQSGPESLAQYFLDMVEDAGESTGFSWFDIDRALTFGEPPDFGTIAQGTFDPAAIMTAFEAHGYVSAEIGGLPALCNAEGCDQGYQHDLRGRNTANPFGGELGRREPLLISPDTLLASPVLERVEGIAAASSGEADSLADDPAYHAAAEAVTSGDGMLIQAQFINPLVVNGAPIALDEASQSAMDEQIAAYSALPPYELAVLADRQEGETQVAVIALVYSDEASAQAAASELAARLENFNPPSMESDTPIISDQGGTIESGSVYTASTGDRYVAVARVAYPLPTLDAIASETPAPAAGRIFRLLVDSLNRRGLIPLVVTG